MIELVDLCVEMQKRVIAAHEQSLAATKTAMDEAKQNIEATQTTQKALWDRWVALWTFRK